MPLRARALSFPDFNLPDRQLQLIVHDHQPRGAFIFRCRQRGEEGAPGRGDGFAGQVHEGGGLPEGEVLGGGEETRGVGAGFLEGGRVEPGGEVGEDGVAGGVEGVGVGWGRVADGGDEEGADGGHGGIFFWWWWLMMKSDWDVFNYGSL